MLKPRIIKSETCPRCKLYLKQLTQQRVEFLIYDADAEENQKQLDAWRISSMPVVQIVDVKEDGSQELIEQMPAGRIKPRTLCMRIKILSDQRAKR